MEYILLRYRCSLKFTQVKLSIVLLHANKSHLRVNLHLIYESIVGLDSILPSTAGIRFVEHP